MKLVKYSEFNQELNESFWDDVKYGFSKLGTYKAGGKIFGKGKVKKEAAAEVEELLKKESNKLLKTVVEDVEKNVAPEFPNSRMKITFLRGIIVYGQFYDTIAAAAKKSSKEEGYLAPEVANELIESLRKVVKRYLDVELKAVYTTFENVENDSITENEILELYNYTDELENAINEEFIKKLLTGAARSIAKGYQAIGNVKDKAMDSMFGAKKGVDDDEVKKVGGQSAKFQSTSGEKNVETERMKGLESNKLPMTLFGVGSALGAFSWLVNTEWFKSLFTTIEHTDKVEMIQKTVQTKSEIFSTVKPGEGMTQIMNRTMNLNLNPGSSPEEFLAGMKTLGGGNVQAGIDAFCAKGGVFPNSDAAKSALELIAKSPHQHGDTLGQIFQGKMAGTGKVFGDVFVTTPGSTLTGLIVKTIVTAVPKIVTTSVIKIGAGYGVAKGLGSVLGPLGLTLVAAGAVVKLLREKGQRQSRAKTLDNLLQSLILVSVDVKKEGGEENGIEGGEEKAGIPSEKTIYPLMIKNLKALNSMLISFDGVKAEGEGGDKKNQGLKIGNEYLYTNKKGDKKKVKLISLTHDTSIGSDKTWITKDDIKKDTLASGKVSVIFRDKEGKYTGKSPEIAVDSNQLAPLKEALLLEKEFGKGSRNVEVTKGEDYLTQALGNIRKSIKSIKDEKDKGIGITTKFLTDILDKKMDSNSKEPIKNLYKEIYSYLYGDKSKTLSDFGPLYKESIEILSNKSKSQVVAEKIARLSKRSFQFEGENLYGGLGEFGQDMEEFNITLKQIMAYMKSKSEVKESRILSFKNYIKS